MSLLTRFRRKENTVTDTTGAWPDGVIARYLAVCGATVDLSGSGHSWRAECNGCGKTHSEVAEWVARDRAQAHAESCRALPRPGGN